MLVFEDGKFKISSIRAMPCYQNESFSLDIESPMKGTHIESILSKSDALINNFVVTFGDHNSAISVKRDKPLPLVSIDWNTANVNRHKYMENDVCDLVIKAKKHLKEYDYSTELKDVLGQKLEDHYRHRETELARLNDLIDTQVEKNHDYQKKLLDDYREQGRIQERETESIRLKYKEAHEAQQQELKKREEEFQVKESAFETHESKYIRRKIRQELKNELANRNIKFELTKGTQSLRRPIFWFSIILLSIFGINLGFSSYSTIQILLKDSDAVSHGLLSGLWPLIAKQLLYLLAFGSTSIFFIRWNNQWFQQHAIEEFNLKQFDLDVDRASWVVELAMEWKKEMETEIPAPLLEQLTKNLFEREAVKEAVLHPADHLASALLGAASGVKLKLPGGGEIAYDQKGLKKLKNTDSPKEEPKE